MTLAGWIAPEIAAITVNSLRDTSQCSSYSIGVASGVSVKHDADEDENDGPAAVMRDGSL
jgi:hypothetical protein